MFNFIKKHFWEITGSLFVMLFLFSGFYKCPFKLITGIPCMGCGMTRAWESVFVGEFQKAFLYHPLFWTVPIFIIIYFYKDKIPSKLYGILIWTGIFAFLLVYIYRMQSGTDLIYACEFKKSLIYKIIQLIN